VSWTEDEKKERICGVLEQIREQNPGKRILLLLAKHDAHICEYMRKRAHQLGIGLVFFLPKSPHLDPIETTEERGLTPRSATSRLVDRY
jgi:hypothetical protein